MKLVLAEKKSQAEKLAAPFQFTEKNGYFEVEPSKIFPNGAYITYAMGHLFSLAQPEEYDAKYKQWAIKDLPILPDTMKYTLVGSKAKQFKVIKGLVNDTNVTETIIATDPGREGEHIGSIVLQMCGNKKPVKRLWTTSLTSSAVLRAFEHLLDGDEKKPLFHEAQARAYADWMVGMNTSRVYTLLLRDKGNKEVFSTGRVQTPLLALIVDREKAIEAFVPQPFWEVFAEFSIQGKTYKGKWFKEDMERLDSFQQAQTLAGYCQGKEAEIFELETERKEFHPPLLFSLSTLQVAANKQFSYSPDAVLKICQDLYEKKYLSYPRSDSHYITEEEAKTFPLILTNLKQIPCFQGFLPTPYPNILGNKLFVNPEKVSDHHAIIITEDLPEWSKLSEEEKNIYELVARSVIAAHYDSAIIDFTRVVTAVDNSFTFITNGRQVISEGWCKVVTPAEEDEQNVLLPSLQEGQLGVTSHAECKEGKTKPPKRFTEGDLIPLMKSAGKSLAEEDSALGKILKEAEGLGTEATRASIIETLKSREFILVKKNLVYPTEKGRTLIQAIGMDSVLSSAILTARWEQKLREIGLGKGNKQSFIDQAKKLSQKLVEDAIRSISVMESVVPKTEPSKEEAETQVNDPTQPEKKDEYHPPSKKRETLAPSPTPKNDLSSTNEHDNFMHGGKENFGPCPRCHEPMVDRGDFYGCSSYTKTGCGITLQKKLLGVTIPPEQVRKLMHDGETNLIEGFTSRSSSKPFKAVLSWENQKLTFKSPTTTKLVLPLKLLEPLEIYTPSEEDTRKIFHTIERETEAMKHRAKVVAVTHGPRVSRYELIPERGVNIKGYNRFSANFQAVLKASRITIYAPIPLTDRVGIEVPTKNPYPVQLRGLLENEEYLATKKDLSFAVGLNLQGKPINANLATMPHLLLAGTTGSGKSVALNSIIISLLYNLKSDRLKFMFIDPKQVELSVYQELPHLFSPVVTQVNKAGKALEYLVKEMDDRYFQFSKAGVKNLDGWNEKQKDHPLPYIVLVIDELADLLMMTDSGVEDLIQRICQLGRAAGIHAIIATQRPTKKVLSPTIKANLPVRIAFSVASSADSMTILDTVGAENLLGKGDMIYQSNTGPSIRLQSAYVSDDEIARVLKFIKENHK